MNGPPSGRTASTVSFHGAMSRLVSASISAPVGAAPTPSWPRRWNTTMSVVTPVPDWRSNADPGRRIAPRNQPSSPSLWRWEGMRASSVPVEVIAMRSPPGRSVHSAFASA